MKDLLILLLLASPSWAACTGSSPNLSAPDTRNAATNGANLAACLAAARDGDSITLTHGALYDSPANDESITIPARRNAAAYVTIKSDGTIPAGRASPADSAQYAVIETPSNAGPIKFGKNSSYWKFTGIIFQTASSSYGNKKFVSSPLIFHDANSVLGELAHHLIFDQVICRPYEAVVPHLNRTAQQCYQTEGHDVTFSNSYVYGFGGVSNDPNQAPQKNISAVTPDVTLTATSTGHGLGAGSNLQAAIEGATGAWSRINGMSYITVTSGNSFTVKKHIGLARVARNTAKIYIDFYAASNLQPGDPITISGYTTAKALNGAFKVNTVGADPDTSPYFTITTAGVANGNYCYSNWKTCGNYEDQAFVTPNMTGKGTLTGTVYARVRAGDWSLNSYAFLQIAGNGPVYIYNNFCQAQFSCLFAGGGGASSSHTATLTAASPGQATFSSLGNLQVGDIVAVQVTGHPTKGEGCSQRSLSAGCVYYQAAKVTAISPSTKVVTWKGYGNQPLVSGQTGTLSIRGTTATWLSGDPWPSSNAVGGYLTGLPLRIGSSPYIILSKDSPTQLTLETAPPSGTYTWTMANVADTPGSVQWNGALPDHIYFRRNTVDKDASISYGSICKAASELKTLAYLLVEGTHYTGTPCVTWGEPTFNQTGMSPWSRKIDNVERGGLVDSAERGLVASGDDPYRTAIVNYDGTEKTGTRNNLWTDYLFLNASSWDTPIGIGGFDSSTVLEHIGFVFSAASAAEGQSPARFGASNGCAPDLTPPYGMIQAKIRNNILPYGVYGFVGGSPCMNAPNPGGQITNNLFLDNQNVGSDAILDAFPKGTKYAANQGKIGYHPGCDGTAANWKNCYLDDRAPGRAAASDGRDIGPDIDLINDLINDFSCQAGLCDALTGASNNKAFAIGATTASITFTIQGTVASNCTLKLYTDPARSKIAADTNSSSKQACDRAGNTVMGKQVTFNLGSSAPLNASRTYYYKIAVTDSGEVMVGKITTSSK